MVTPTAALGIARTHAELAAQAVHFEVALQRDHRFKIAVDRNSGSARLGLGPASHPHAKAAARASARQLRELAQQLEAAADLLEARVDAYHREHAA